MILYHFTWAQNLPSLLEHGIRPSQPDIQSMEQPVVWLTAAETTELSEADIEWLLVQQKKGTFTAEQVDEYKERGMFWHFDCRITVRLEQSKRLLHYASWLECQTDPIIAQHARILLETNSPSALVNFYVYFGTIQPHRIDSILALTEEAAADLQGAGLESEA
jgi:hypothetical protein